MPGKKLSSEKRAIVAATLAQGLSMREAGRRAGVSVATVSRWSKCDAEIADMVEQERKEFLPTIRGLAVKAMGVLDKALDAGSDMSEFERVKTAGIVVTNAVKAEQAAANAKKKEGEAVGAPATREELVRRLREEVPRELLLEAAGD